MDMIRQQMLLHGEGSIFPLAGELTVGSRIRERRVKLGLSQRELGLILRVGQTTVAGWEADKNLPKLSMLKRLADALRTSTSWLQGEISEVGRAVLRGYLGERGRVTVLEDNPPQIVGIAFARQDVEAIEVRVDAFPVYGAGDVVLVDNNAYPPDDLVGSECLLQMGNGEWVLGRVFRGDGRHFTIVTVGGDVLINEEIRVCRPVRASERR
jgi:transcriptional regulator with XRE-family HTH domain